MKATHPPRHDKFDRDLEPIGRYEAPVTVLDDRGADPLLDRLRQVHGEAGRP